MGFTTSRQPTGSGAPTTTNLFDSGSGVAAPSDGNDLANLLNRYLSGLPTVAGTQAAGSTGSRTTTITTSAHGSISFAPPAGVPETDPAYVSWHDASPHPVSIIRAIFVTDKPAVVGSNHAQGSVKASNGSVVVGMGDGAFGLSADGKGDWAPVAFPAGMTSFEWNQYGGLKPRLIWSGTRFIAYGFSSSGIFKILTSMDGAAWTVYASPFGNSAYDVLNFAAAGDTVVASDGGHTVFVSSDGGVTWPGSSHSVSSTRNVTTIGYNGSHHTAITQSFSGAEFVPATSPDGITWTAGTTVALPSASTFWGSMLWHGSGFLAYATKGGSVPSPQTPLFFYSLDGTTFSASTIPAGLLTDLIQNSPDNIITASNGTNIVVLSKYVGGPTVFTSTDNGANFTACSTGAASSFKSIVAHNGLFILYSATDDSRRYTSPNGIIWTEVLLSSPGVSLTKADIDAWNARRSPSDLLLRYFIDTRDALASAPPISLPPGITPFPGTYYLNPAMPAIFQGFCRFSPESGLTFPDYITIHDGCGRHYDPDNWQWSDAAAQTYPANIAAARYAARLAPNGACIVAGHYADGTVEFWLWVGFEKRKGPEAVAIWRRGKLLDFTSGYFTDFDGTADQWAAVPTVNYPDNPLWQRFDFVMALRYQVANLPEFTPVLIGWPDVIDGIPAKSAPLVQLTRASVLERLAPPVPYSQSASVLESAAPPVEYHVSAGITDATTPRGTASAAGVTRLTCVPETVEA